MLKSYSRAWCEIDYKAINHNLDEIQKLVGKTKSWESLRRMPMVMEM